MSNSVFKELLQDIEAETAVVLGLVSGLSASEWELPTPAAGWAVRDQISHLAFFDEQAVLSASDPERFREGAAELLALGPEFPDRVAEEYRNLPAANLLDWFRTARTDLVSTFALRDGSLRVPWFGPDMNLTSCATARLMETWAHGLDVAETFGVAIEPSMRIRHIAHLGVRTMGFSFVLRGRQAPEAAVRVELRAPDGSRWSWGPADAANSVTGSAIDFCLVVTQRRHVADTALDVRGPVAQEWMSIAQAFAGAPSNGREPRLTAGATP